MNAFIMDSITKAAISAGMAPDKVMEISAADSITLPRPRVEYRFLPEVLTRTGKKLSISRKNGVQTTKRELYTVQQDVLVNIFAPAEGAENWLALFCPAFVAALPRGGNDAAGNWVLVRAHKATQARPAVKRVGTAEIRVMERLSTLYQLQFTGRITALEVEGVILDVHINAPAIKNGRKDT